MDVRAQVAVAWGHATHISLSWLRTLLSVCTIAMSDRCSRHVHVPALERRLSPWRNQSRGSSRRTRYGRTALLLVCVHATSNTPSPCGLLVVHQAEALRHRASTDLHHTDDTDSDSSDDDGSGGNAESGESPTMASQPSAGDGGEDGNGKRYKTINLNKPGSGCTHVCPLPVDGSEVAGAGGGAGAGASHSLAVYLGEVLMDKVAQTLYRRPGDIPLSFRLPLNPSYTTMGGSDGNYA